MTLAELAIALALLLLSGMTLAGALIVSRRSRKIMDHRLTLVAAESDGKGKAEEAVPPASRLGAYIQGLFALGMPYHWGTHASGLKLLSLAIAAAATAWLLFHAGLHFSNWTAVPIVAVSFFVMPRMLLRMEQHRTELQFMNYFPDAIDMVVRMLRAGMPVTAAIRSVGHEAPSPVNTVFASLADQVEIGIPFEDALNAAGERIGLADFRFFGVAVSLQRTSGGNLVTTLETLSEIIRRRRATRLKSQAATAEVRMSTYILAAIPFLVIGGLLVLSPTYLTPLIVDPRGNMIVGIAVAMLLLGFLTMRRMMHGAMRL